MKVLVIDTETTGLPESGKPSIYEVEKWPYIIQLSYILYDTLINECIEKYDQVIKLPGHVEVSLKSYEIHKISKEHSNVYGENILTALHMLNQAIIKADTVVGHNISFDKQVIIVEHIRNQIKSNFPSKTTFCTMKCYKSFCNIQKYSKNMRSYIKFPTLAELYEVLFHTHPTNLHNSYNDVLVCLRCYIKKEYNIDVLHHSETYYHEYVRQFNSTSLDMISVYS